MDTHEMIAEGARLSRLLDAGLEALRDQAHALARAEQTYRKAKSEAWVRVRSAPGVELAKEREAWVDADTADLRYARDLADGMRQAALEAVRSRRTQVSALQSFLAADREEAAFSRTGPRGN